MRAKLLLKLEDREPVEVLAGSVGTDPDRAHYVGKPLHLFELPEGCDEEKLLLLVDAALTVEVRAQLAEEDPQETARRETIDADTYREGGPTT